MPLHTPLSETCFRSSASLAVFVFLSLHLRLEKRRPSRQCPLGPLECLLRSVVRILPVD